MNITPTTWRESCRDETSHSRLKIPGAHWFLSTFLVIVVIVILEERWGRDGGSSSFKMPLIVRDGRWCRLGIPLHCVDTWKVEQRVPSISRFSDKSLMEKCMLKIISLDKLNHEHKYNLRLLLKNKPVSLHVI